MTLIISAVSSDHVITVVDSKISGLNSTVSFDENGSKNFKLTSSEDHIMVSFCGMAEIDDPNFGIPNKDALTMNWLGDYVSTFDPTQFTTQELLEKICAKLTSLYCGYYPHKILPLVMTFAGRSRNDSTHTFLKSISNIDHTVSPTSNPYSASIVFMLESIPFNKHGYVVYVNGDMPATKSKLFDAKLKNVHDAFQQRYLANFDTVVRERMQKCIVTAAANSNTINERIVGTILLPDGLMSVKHYPDDGLRQLPGFQTESMFVLSPYATGNVPGEGADYIIGP